MSFHLGKSKKFTFITVLSTSLFLASCTNSVIANSASSANTKALATAKLNELYCPASSESEPLDLTDVKLTRVDNIPLMYQGANNIEGPVWHDGALYYTNMGSHQPDEKGFELSNQTTIWRWVPDSKAEVWLEDTVAGTNGLALNSKGELIATRQLDGSISKIDWQTKQVTPIVSSYQNKRFNSPNDLTLAADDTIYFTDPNWNIPSNVDLATVQGGGNAGSTEEGQRVYRVTADGKVNATAVTELVPALADKPNGIMLSLDQQKLIVGGLQGLWVFDLNKGEVSQPKQLLNTPIDGLGKDCSGNIYVTTTRELADRKDGQVVVILDNNQKEVGTLNVDGIHIVTNIAFGGSDGKTLFVTGLTAPMDGNKLRLCGEEVCLQAGIYTTELNVKGFPF